MKTMKELSAYLVKQGMVEKFAEFADRNGLRRRNLMIRKSHSLLERFINSRIIYNILDDEAWIEYLNSDDHVILRALDVFKAGLAFPKRPVVQPEKGKTAMNVPSCGHADHILKAKPACYA